MIKVEKLCKNYDRFSLKDVSFQVEKGYITGFIGQNGAGKTTVIKSILNLIHMDSGRIEILGMDSVRDSGAIKNKVGVVLDDGIFYERMTVKDLKKISGMFYDHWDNKTFEEYRRKFGLDENKKIMELSRGMRMKLSLCVAFSHNAELFIMDEPTSGLDPIIREELLDILQAYIEDGQKSVFFSTHITSDLEKVADFLVFIDDGRIILKGAKDDILQSHAIVKGGMGELTEPLKKAGIYVYEREHGFEALVEKGAFDLAGYRVEKPYIEDILRFYVKAGGKA